MYLIHAKVQIYLIIFEEKFLTKKEFQASGNTTLKLTWHVYVC